MNPFVWLQSLVTFRKNGGGFQVPELDAQGRIKVTLLTTGAIEVSASPPLTIDGSILWYNTGSNSILFYDLGRAKWLGVEVVDVVGGRAGTTPPGNFYRGQDGMVLDTSTRGIPVSQGCLTSIAWSRTDTGSATLEVLVNGSAIAELNSTVAGATRDDAVNVNFSTGLLSFRNKSGLANTQNVQVAVQYRRRA